MYVLLVETINLKYTRVNKMCDQLDGRGCEVVDELEGIISNLREEKKEIKTALMKDIRRLESRIREFEMKDFHRLVIP